MIILSSPQLLESILDRTHIGGFTREQMVQEGLIKWYLKDDRSVPLELQGYVSGSSASEEEEQSPYNDMTHISQVGGHKGVSYLLPLALRS